MPGIDRLRNRRSQWRGIEDSGHCSTRIDSLWKYGTESLQKMMCEGHRGRSFDRTAGGHPGEVPVIRVYQCLRVAVLRAPTQLAFGLRNVNDTILAVRAHVLPLRERHEISQLHCTKGRSS